MGLTAAAVPLFVVEPMPWQAPAPEAFDGLLLTSANASRHGGGQLGRYRDLPVYAVGEATAAAAREAGLEVAGVGDGGVEQLLAWLPADLRLLHLCGEERLANPGPQEVTAVPVYRSVAIARPAGLDRLSGGVALVHSPRAGRRLAELVNGRNEVAVAAISQAAGDACGPGWASIRAASVPSDAALLSLAVRLCQELDPK